MKLSFELKLSLAEGFILFEEGVASGLCLSKSLVMDELSSYLLSSEMASYSISSPWGAFFGELLETLWDELASSYRKFSN